jgi:hypothetical protein
MCCNYMTQFSANVAAAVGTIIRNRTETTGCFVKNFAIPSLVTNVPTLAQVALTAFANNTVAPGYLATTRHATTVHANKH